MIKKIIIIGAGGHARVLFDLLSHQKIDVFGVVDPSKDKDYMENKFPKCEIYNDDEQIVDLNPDEIMLINGLGSVPNDGYKRKKVFDNFSSRGFTFLSLISNDAIISPAIKFSEGVQIMSGSVIQSGVSIGVNSIINTGSIIDHDCVIGDNNHIAPGAVLSGKVVTGSNVHIGTNSSIIQEIKIGNNVVVGAGSSVAKNVDDGITIYPAKTLLKT